MQEIGELTRERQECFIKALAETGSVTAAAQIAGSSRTRLYEARKADSAFCTAWEEVEDVATDRLEEEARKRALEGVPEPLVSGGRILRDENGQPIIPIVYWWSFSGHVGRHLVKDRCTSICPS